MPHARTASHAFAKGTGFSESEKDRLGIRGLVPPRVFPMDMQLERIMLNLNQCRDNLEKYVFLSALSDRNLTAFYKVS
jgi:malate dehydrogenase (oxaloacetate-decarboxylating)(NADP+)